MKVTPSSTARRLALMSPSSLAEDLRSILSLAMMLPLTAPATATELTNRLPLIWAVLPRTTSPVAWISPLTRPSMRIEPVVLMVPVISTSAEIIDWDALGASLMDAPWGFEKQGAKS
ncbi:MAG: hypothetical protein U1F77_11305 [Kiritimatiellia bacterium]